MNKVHPRLYKIKQKETKNVLHLNNIRKKNTLPINKAKWDRLWMCIIIRANYIIIIIIRANLGSTAERTKASSAPQTFIDGLVLKH